MAAPGVATAPGAPRVSIVMPFRNAEPHLAEAIGSVLRQTCARWELLLVDDGSTDASTGIAQGYARHDPERIRYVAHSRHATLGRSMSRNAGAARARGEYLALLDADDVFLPQKLERQLSFLESHPGIDATFGDSLWWYSWTGRPEDVERDAPRRLRIRAGSVFEPGALNTALVRRSIMTPATCSVLLRRAAFDRVGGFENRFDGMYDDQACFFKLFLHCRTHMSAGILDWYRQHPRSCCALAAAAGDYRPDGGPSPARQRYLDWMAEYLRTRRGHRGLRYVVELQRWRERGGQRSARG